MFVKDLSLPRKAGHFDGIITFDDYILKFLLRNIDERNIEKGSFKKGAS
jgi:hypothetical protein